MDGQMLEPRDRSKPPCCLTCTATNSYFFLTDPTATTNPANPVIVVKKAMNDLTRLVRGHSPQLIYTGWAKRDVLGDKGEEYIVLVCHRDTDRNALLESLHSLSQGSGMAKHRVPLQMDGTLRRTLEDQISDQILIATFALNARGNTRMFVMSDAQVHEYTLHFENWTPPDENADDSDEPDVPEDAVQICPNSNSMPLAPRGCAASDMQQLVGTGGSNEAVEAATHIAVQRFQYRDAEQRRLEATLANQRKGDLVELTNAAGKKLSSLSKVAFLPGKLPKVELGFGNEGTLIIQFFDESSRENWRRHLMGQLSKGAENWKRHYQTKNGD